MNRLRPSKTHNTFGFDDADGNIRVFHIVDSHFLSPDLSLLFNVSRFSFRNCSVSFTVLSEIPVFADC